MQKPGNLRTDMPTVAGWIDDLRDAFGARTDQRRHPAPDRPAYLLRRKRALWARNRRAKGSLYRAE